MARAVQAFLLALRDLPNARVLRILALSLALTLLLFVAAGAAILFAARRLLDHGRWLGESGTDMASALLVLLLVAGSWLLFRAAAIVVVGLFADGIVAEVEGRHYPAAAGRAVPVGWGRGLRLALASLGRLIAGNLVALPFYILLLVTGSARCCSRSASTRCCSAAISRRWCSRAIRTGRASIAARAGRRACCPPHLS